MVYSILRGEEIVRVSAHKPQAATRLGVTIKDLTDEQQAQARAAVQRAAARTAAAAEAAEAEAEAAEAKAKADAEARAEAFKASAVAAQAAQAAQQAANYAVEEALRVAKQPLQTPPMPMQMPMHAPHGACVCGAAAVPSVPAQYMAAPTPNLGVCPPAAPADAVDPHSRFNSAASPPAPLGSAANPCRSSFFTTAGSAAAG